jgi:hypothetical protein
MHGLIKLWPEEGMIKWIVPKASTNLPSNETNSVLALIALGLSSDSRKT